MAPKMNKRDPKSILWLSEVESQDCDAAASYLALIHPKPKVAKLVTALRRAPITQFKAKDIFRASRLSLLGVSNFHVEKDRQKIRGGQRLSPILLVRNEPNGTVVIAEGYHRLFAVYSIDEDAMVPSNIV